MTRRKKTKGPDDRRGKNPNSLKNLRPPIKPGEVRNPLGINAKTPMTDEYRRCAAEPLPESIRKKLNRNMGEEVLMPGDTWARANALRRFLHAVTEEGGVRSSSEIREAIEGIAPHRLEIAAGGSKKMGWPTIVVGFVEAAKYDPMPGVKTIEALPPAPGETNGNGNDSGT